MWKYAEYKEPQMKISRSILLSLMLAAAFALTGCGRQDNDAPLAFVPADTAYVFANIKPLPDAVSRAWFDRLEPLNVALAPVGQPLDAAFLTAYVILFGRSPDCHDGIPSLYSSTVIAVMPVLG